jgi:hypothetical protein
LSLCITPGMPHAASTRRLHAILDGYAAHIGKLSRSTAPTFAECRPILDLMKLKKVGLQSTLRKRIKIEWPPAKLRD